MRAATEPREGHAVVTWDEDPVQGGSFVDGTWEQCPCCNGIFVAGSPTWPEDDSDGDSIEQTGRLYMRARCSACRSRLIYDPERLQAFCSDTYPKHLG